MRIVTYNIQYGHGRDGGTDLARIARAVDGADVIALQEVERFWQRTGMIDQAAELAALLRPYHWVYGANLDMSADLSDGDGRPVHRRRQFGNMLMSKTPIVSSRNYLLPKAAMLNRHSLQRGALEAVVETAHGAVRFYSLHLDHLDRGLQLAQIDALLEFHRRAPSEGGAWCGAHQDEAWTRDGPAPPMPSEAIVLGDFNMLASMPNYERMVGLRAPDGGRVHRLNGFVDAWVAAGHPEDSGDTMGDGRRIDYCFVSTALAGRVRGATIDSAAQGSDHQPLWTEMDL